jgi:hypothetical protein
MKDNFSFEKRKETQKQEFLEIEKLKERIQEIESEVKKAKPERAARERRERPYPLPGESFGAWLSRIGGPFVKVEVLQICPKCKRPVPFKRTCFSSLF